ncbi:MAG TPA: DUF47 family protein [Longimicrobiales bacterium]|nr:DUF47 family protein [Longimicrobiales bacterium]
MRAIVGLFARSPFGPLLEHTERVHQTVELLPELFAAFTAARWDEVQAVYEKISHLEHKADALNLRVVRNIIVSWLATVPFAAAFSAAIYFALRALFL